jgi:hypothetical protein
MNISRRLLLAASISFLISPPVKADLYDDYLNSVSKVPFVAFLVRGGFPGHAIVAIGVELDNGLLFYESILGYYPKDQSIMGDIKATLSAVPGVLEFQFKDLSWEINYRIVVTETQKQAALAVAKTWLASDPKYNLLALGGKNCSVFAGEVAKAIGLKVPSGPGRKLPIDFVRELSALNGNK